MKKKDLLKTKKKRPEDLHENPLDYFRDETLNQYASSKSMMRIQQKITLRAMELLNMEKENALILDAGSGPGFSSAIIKDLGFNVVSLDLNEKLLNFYKIRELNPIVGDICSLPFRPEVFDGIISISAIQWLLKENKSKFFQDFSRAIKNFHEILKKNSNLVLQFYPKNEHVLKEMGKIITDATSFKGNFIIDNVKNPKKRKIFLLLNKGH